jgi:enterochelin esterase family protein
MSRAIRGLMGGEPPDGERIEAFLAGREVPIREGTTTTFLWRGDADRVLLRHWIYGLPSSHRLKRIAGTDLWWVTLEVPERSRIEYKFEVVVDGRRRLRRDRFNPHTARDPFGVNSVLHGVGYQTPQWTRHDPRARPGTIEEMVLPSDAFGEERRVLVYLPARLRRSRRYPLLVVHDGEDYLRYAEFGTVLDNLIDRREIAPLVAVLTHSHDRLREYAADRRHARFVAEELVPRVADLFPIEEDPAHRGIMGASFGAVAALHAAWSYPGRFGRLLLQSGSFAFSDIGRHRRSRVFDPVAKFVNAFRDAPGRPAERLYVTCGRYESLIYENRSLVPLLTEAGMEVRYREARDGHNWQNWRDRLRSALSWLFPGPLWMVYE